MMSNENKENNLNIEQEQKTNKNWWKKLLGLKPTYKLFVFFILFILSNSICIAGEIPKFNPKDTNPKPGLYRLDRMHNRRYKHPMTILQDGKVFISGTDADFSDGKGYKTAEIFNPKTGKFSEIETLFAHNILGHKSVLMSNGNVLLSCGYEKKVIPVMVNDRTKGRYEIYDTATNKFYPGPKSNLSCKRPVFLENNNDGNIIAYGVAEIEGKLRTVYEEYNVKSNTVSNIAKYNNSNDNLYYIGKHKEKDPKKLMSFVRENIGFPYNQIAYLSNGNYLYAAMKEVDYGVKLSNEITSRYEKNTSWFSPLYIINENKWEIINIGEYLRSRYPTCVKLKDKNMILITGGLYPLFLLYNPDIDPKDIPLDVRIFDAGGNASRSAYIFVY